MNSSQLGAYIHQIIIIIIPIVVVVHHGHGVQSLLR